MIDADFCQEIAPARSLRGRGRPIWARAPVVHDALAASDRATPPASGPMDTSAGDVCDPSTDSAERKRAAGRLRILVVEDEAIIAMEIEDLLSEIGALVVGGALNADQAIRLAERERPDCITMDIHIQGDRDGISAAIEIYQRFGIRSVFVSAFGNPETIARAQAAMPLGWISKPISKWQLEQIMRSVREGK